MAVVMNVFLKKFTSKNPKGGLSSSLLHSMNLLTNIRSPSQYQQALSTSLNFHFNKNPTSTDQSANS